MYLTDKHRFPQIFIFYLWKSVLIPSKTAFLACAVGTIAW